MNIGQRRHARFRALAEPPERWLRCLLREVWLLGPRLHHHLRLQAADDVT
jgi:hypothetical protein